MFGLFRVNATPTKLQAFALRSDAKAIAFQELEFFDADGEVTVSSRMSAR